MKTVKFKMSHEYCILVGYIVAFLDIMFMLLVVLQHLLVLMSAV